MTLRSSVLSLGSNPVVKADRDERVIHFEETRFRSHALPFQESLRSLADVLASELEIPLHTSKTLDLESEQDLGSKVYCVFDFLDIQTSSRSGHLQAQWLPLVLFSKGLKVFSVKAVYDKNGAKLKGLTLFLHGKEEDTLCPNLDVATSIGLGYVRTNLNTGSK